LAHARDHSRDAKAEGADSGDTGWEGLGAVVELWAVAGEAVFEEEVVGKGDAFVDG
jgi:hypothetical protein